MATATGATTSCPECARSMQVVDVSKTVTCPDCREQFIPARNTSYSSPDGMEMGQATRYRCVACGSDRFLPEPPQDPRDRVSVGCDRCEEIQPHVPQGIRSHKQVR